MVNTRAKIRRTRDTLKLCFSPASVADSDHQSTPSAAMVASNDDLLIEILRRLPANSVLRFKSVSKHWRSLMSHRRFTLLYNRDSTAPGLFVRNFYISFDVESQRTPPFRDLDFYPDLCGIRIVQSCNGLLLCCSHRGNERARKYYVFNPTTKQYAIIPSVPGGRDIRKTIRFMGLAFHRTDCPHYKVVCIHRAQSNEERFQIQIYSSHSGKWKISGEPFYAHYYTPFCYGVYWNQAIHWAPSCINPLYIKLDVEQLQPLPLPVQVGVSSFRYQDGPMPLYFGESRGHLHLVESVHGESRLHLNVYEMLEDHSGWFVKYPVELDELPGVYPEMIQSQDPSSPYYYEFEVVDVVRGEEEDDAFMVVRVPGKLVRYNIVEKSFKQIYELGNNFYGRFRDSDVHRYVETLASF